MKKVWELPPGTAMLGVGSSGGGPFGYPPRLRSGLRQNRAGFLEKREKGRTPLSANLSGILFWAVNPSPGANQQALTGIFEFPRSRLLVSFAESFFWGITSGLRDVSTIWSTTDRNPLSVDVKAIVPF